mmetsp:Transcript_7528/g.33507  ORF Transcript_7528/g.33507 Transcript_7528/m.33507 type:complete len:210 (+) Transcript_7528:1224-1853(+)
MLIQMSKFIGENSLMAVSQVEQEIVCGSDRSYAFKGVMGHLNDDKVKPFECLKLVLLFALRYGNEGRHQVDEMIATLSQQDIEYTDAKSLKNTIKLMGQNNRLSDLFADQNFLARASKFVGGLKGDDNVYTQHQPILIQVFSFICRKTYVEFTYYNCIVMSCCPCITDVGKSGKGKDEGRRLPASERLPWIKRGQTTTNSGFHKWRCHV